MTRNAEIYTGQPVSFLYTDYTKHAFNAAADVV